jgi:hypothetical protein
MAGGLFPGWSDVIPRISVFSLALLLASAPSLCAQKAPELGYVFPAGGKAGTTIEVRLGGYDWTPDMELFVHDKRVKLQPTGPPGPLLIPPPPYWFGAKGRIAALPLPREMLARLVLPADVPAGPISWQAANANGGTSAGVFFVGDGTEIVEDESRTGPQRLPRLPVTVSGRLLKNEEVDAFRFTASRDGPVTCDLMARRLGAKFLPLLTIRDRSGQVLVDAAGTSGRDLCLTFRAQANEAYVVTIHDLDFGGDRSFVYRLTLTETPRVLGARPAAGRRGETREVEFVGIGVGTGQAKLETVRRRVTFPTKGDTFSYRLETPFGIAPPLEMPVSDWPEITEAKLTSGPVGITGVLDRQEAVGRHTFRWKKGEVWSLTVDARRIGSPLDVQLAVLAPDGRELARNEDLPETTDAGLDFAAPTDGDYQVVVSDAAGKSGSAAALYRLVARHPVPDFTLNLLAQRLSIPLGGKADLAVKAVRSGGFQEPIALEVRGLPEGVRAPENLTIPAGKSDVTISLEAAKNAPAAAGLVTVVGTATIAGKAFSRVAWAPAAANRAPRGPEDNRVPAVLVVTTLKPLFKGRPVDQDTGRKVPRGSTFPAEVLVERLDGFQGPIVLQMASRQSYQVQGITGGDVLVPPGVTKTIYPCYMPEWLETIRTSRMGMIGVAKVADSTGRVRYQVNEITGFITMTMEGALLRVSALQQELTVPAGRPFDVPLKISRQAKLPEPVRLELRLPDELAGKVHMEPLLVPMGKEQISVRIVPASGLIGLHVFSIRGTALQEGKYPAISEVRVAVEFLPGGTD